jgi:hypothetical protein
LPIVSPSEAWLALLPFIAIISGVAGDQLISAFDQAWAILIPLPRVVLVVTMILVVLAGGQTWSLMGELGHATGSTQNETQTAIGQYLANCLRGETGDAPCAQQGPNAPIFYVPAGILNQPATRLLLGAALENGRMRAFDPSRDLLPSTTPAGDLFYLVAIEDQPVIDLMQQLYPTAKLHAEPTDQAGPTRFLVIQIPLADVVAHQGLAGQYYAGATATGTAQETRIDGPLAFDWGSNRPIEGPFSVVWDGSLLVPAPGDYAFTLLGLDNSSNSSGGQPGPVVSVQLDGNLILDSSLGLAAKTQQLAQGAYHFTMRYHTDGPASDWALHWTPPGGIEQVLPREQFYSPALPNIGLIGAYYDGSNWDGKLLALRKDMVLGAPVDLPLPYSVDWTGKLAANRAGEYYFAVTANGPVKLTIDGTDTLFHTPSSDPATGPGYSQSSIYLEQGWHDIDLRYAPSAISDLRVLWQPPGSSPLLLAGRYLLPTQAPVTMADVPLPSAPALVDATLGNDNFALSVNMQPYRPVPSIPPSNLPLLASEQVWTLANGCGAGDFQFASPRGIAIDSQNGRIYVADSDNHRVTELRLDDGSRMTTYALPGFQEPVDVAIDPGGALLVLDATVQNIVRIDRATGEAAPLSMNTGFYHPRGFAVDQGGNIIVADTGGARVVVLDATGTFLTQFGGTDSGLGQGQPTDVQVLGNQLWAISADSGRLWRLDNMGSVPVSNRASTVTGPQLATLPDGSGFFMSDPARRTVLYFTPDGQPLGQLGYSDTFANPVGVAAAFDQQGLVNLVVGDSASCTVSLWRLRTR